MLELLDVRACLWPDSLKSVVFSCTNSTHRFIRIHTPYIKRRLLARSHANTHVHLINKSISICAQAGG